MLFTGRSGIFQRHSFIVEAWRMKDKVGRAQYITEV